MDLGLDRTPNCTGPRSGPFRVRIEARQRWVASARVSSMVWLEADQQCSVTETKKTMVENARGVRGVWFTTRVLEKSEPHSTKERSSTELRSLRSELKYEVSW